MYAEKKPTEGDTSKLAALAEEIDYTCGATMEDFIDESGQPTNPFWLVS